MATEEQVVANVLANPKYHDLVKRRSTFGWTLTIIMLVVMALLLAMRHSANIIRLVKGTEPKLGEKKTAVNTPAHTTTHTKSKKHH